MKKEIRWVRNVADIAKTRSSHKFWSKNI